MHGPHTRRGSRPGRLRGAIRWTLVGAFSLLTGAVVAAVVIASTTSIVEEHVHRIILEKASERTDGRLSIGGIGLSYLPLRVTARNVALDHASEGRLLEAEAVEVSIDLVSLLTDEIHLQEVALVRPVLDLEVMEGRILNLPRLEPAGDGPAVILESLDVSNGLVRARVRETAPWPVDVALGNLDIDLTADRNTHFEARVRAGSGEATAGDVSRTLDSLSGRATVDLRDGGYAVAIKALELDLLDTALSLAAGTMEVTRDGEVTAGTEFAASIPLAMVSSLAPRAPELEGTASCQGRLSYTASGHEVDATCSAHDVAIQGRTVGDIDAGVTLDRRSLVVSGASVRHPAGEVHLDASLALDTGRHELDLDASLGGIRLSTLAASAGMEHGPADLTLSGPARASGTLDPLDLQGEVDLTARDVEVTVKGPGKRRPVLVPSRSIGLRSAFAVTREELRFQGARVSVGSSLVRASGTVGFDRTLEVLVSSPGFDSLDLVRLPGAGLQAAGSFQGKITGSLDDPRISASAKLGTLRIGKSDLGRVEGRMRARPARRIIELEDVSGTYSRSAYMLPACTITLRAARKGGVLVEGTLIAGDIHLPDLARMLDSELLRDAGGAIAGRIAFSAEPDRGPEAMTLDVDAIVHDLSLAGQAIGSGRVDGLWDRGRVQVRELHLEGDIGRLSASGTSNEAGELDLRIRLAGLDSHRIARVDLAARGLVFVADLDLHVTGTAREPEIDDGILIVSGLAYRGQALGNSIVSIRYRDQVLGLDGLVAGGLVTLASSTQTGGRFRTPLEIGFHELVLDREVLGLSSLASAQGTFTGTVKANLLLSGGLEAKGRVRLEKAELALPEYTVRNKGVVKMAFTERRLTLELVKLGGEGTLVDVSGHVERTGPDLRLTGTADLGLLARFAGKVETARGSLEPGLTIEGTWEKLKVKGKVGLECEELELEGFPLRITETTGRALFTDSGMVLDAEGRIGSGTFTTSGRMPMEGFRPAGYDLHLDFNDVSTKLRDELPVGLEGRLHLEGKAGDQLPLLSGDVWITRLRYSKKFQLARGPRLGGVGPVKSVQTYTHGKNALRLDIALHGTKNLRLENNVLDVDFAIDETLKPFRVIGTDRRPAIVGTVRIKRGTLTWQNRTFEITQGLVDFSNKNRIEPQFDIIAEGDVRTWHLVLQAAGTPDDFKVVVNSTPPLGDEDVVCLLASEMTCEEASQGLGFVSSYGLNKLLGSFRRFESVGFGSQYNPSSGKSEPVVTFKKKFSEKMSLKAVSTLFKNKDTGEDQYIKASIAYEVTDSLSIEGSYDTKNLGEGSGLGNLGVDVTWSFEF